MQIDTHVHVISDNKGRFPLNPSPVWPGIPIMDWSTQHTLTIEILFELMDEAGVDLVTLVQGQTPYGFDNRYVLDCAQKHPKRAKAICSIDMSESNPSVRLKELIDEGAQAARIFPFLVNGHTWLDEPKADSLWELAAVTGTPIDICLYNSSPLPHLRRLLEKYPTVAVTLDHLGHVTASTIDSLDDAIAPLLPMTGLTNLYLKFSPVNLSKIGQAGSPVQTLTQMLASRFGANRMIWGTNYPATRNHGYKDLWDMGRNSVATMGKVDQALALGGTAFNLWPSWDRPAASTDI